MTIAHTTDAMGARVWALKQSAYAQVEVSWNVMAHAQKPDFVFRRKGRVHLNRPGASVQSTTGNRGVRISGSNAGYTMFRGSVKGTGYPLHSAVSLSLPLPCVTVCHHILTGVSTLLLCLRELYTSLIPSLNTGPWNQPVNISLRRTYVANSIVELRCNFYKIEHKQLNDQSCRFHCATWTIFPCTESYKQPPLSGISSFPTSSMIPCLRKNILEANRM